MVRNVESDPDLDEPITVDENFKVGEQYKVALSAMQLIDFDLKKRTKNYELISDAARKVMSQKASRRSERESIAAEYLAKESEDKSLELSKDAIIYLSREAVRVSESLDNNHRYYGKSDAELIAKSKNTKNKILPKGPAPTGRAYVETIIAGPEVLILAEPGNRNTPPRFITEPVTYVQAGDLYESVSLATDFNTTDTLAYEIMLGPDGITIDQNGLVQWQTTSDDILTEQEFGTEPDANLIQIKVSDNRGGSAVQEYHLEVGQLYPSRNLEIFTTPVDNSIMPGDTFAYEIGVMGAGENPVTWELLEFPAGMNVISNQNMSFDGSFADIEWITETDEELGSYRVIVQATTTINGKEVSDQQEFFINVETNSDNLREFIDESIETLFDLWFFN